MSRLPSWDVASRWNLPGACRPPARRDPGKHPITPAAERVRFLARVIDSNPELLATCEEAIDLHQSWKEAQRESRKGGSGRPVEVELRTALISFLLQADAFDNFHMTNTAHLLLELPVELRTELGIDRWAKVPNTGLDDSEGEYRPTQVTYRQLNGRFNAVRDGLDPMYPGLDDDEVQRRATLCQRFAHIAARAVQHAVVAGDATMKWAWDRPNNAGGKLDRRGSEGDGGRPLPLSAIVGEDLDGTESVFDPISDPDRQVPPDSWPTFLPPAVRAKIATKAKNHRTGAVWLTPEDKSKWVFGYGLHWFVNSDAAAPNTVEHYVTAPATANPAGALLPLLRDLWDARSADPLVAEMVAASEGRVLGNVLTDTAYCGPAAWQLGIEAMGGNPSWRLHRTNQDGRRIVDGPTSLNARHICECCPPECDEPFPIFSHGLQPPRR